MSTPNYGSPPSEAVGQESSRVRHSNEQGTPSNPNSIRPHVIALNHFPEKKLNKFLKKLDRSQSWQVLGYILVKHHKDASLVLEMNKPMKSTDLPKFSRWCQSKMRNKKIAAAWATQPQMFELIAKKVKAWRSTKKAQVPKSSSSHSLVKQGVQNQNVGFLWNGRVSAQTSGSVTPVWKSPGRPFHYSQNLTPQTPSLNGNSDSELDRLRQESDSLLFLEKASNAPVIDDYGKRDRRSVENEAATIQNCQEDHRIRSASVLYRNPYAPERNYWNPQNLAGGSLFQVSSNPYPYANHPNFVGRADSAPTKSINGADQNLYGHSLSPPTRHQWSNPGQTGWDANGQLTYDSGLSLPSPRECVGNYGFSNGGGRQRRYSLPSSNNLYAYKHSKEETLSSGNHSGSEVIFLSRRYPLQRNSTERHTQVKSKSVKKRRKKRKGKISKRPVNRSNRKPIICLFLPFQGVIMTENITLPTHCHDATPELAKKLVLLKHIIYLTRCQLVLTGIARHNPAFVQFVNQIFKAWGMAPFYSATVPIALGDISPEDQRAQEIMHWLESRWNTKKWCVLDTMDLTLSSGVMKEAIKVDDRIGLTLNNGRDILRVLGVELDLYK